MLSIYIRKDFKISCYGIEISEIITVPPTIARDCLGCRTLDMEFSENLFSGGTAIFVICIVGKQFKICFGCLSRKNQHDGRKIVNIAIRKVFFIIL